MSTDTIQNVIEQNIVVTRVIAAPVERVWKAWTEPEHLMQWWGPSNYTSPSCEMDFREGGKYIFCMRAPDEQGGLDHFTTGTYGRIVPMQSIEFTSSMSDKDGNKLDPTHVGMPTDFPAEIHTVVSFRELIEGVTELTVTELGWRPGQMAVFSLIGWHQSIDKLAASVR